MTFEEGWIIFFFLIIVNAANCRWEWAEAVVKLLDMWAMLDSPVTPSASVNDPCSTAGISCDALPVVPCNCSLTFCSCKI